MEAKLLKNYWFWVVFVLSASLFLMFFRFDLPDDRVSQSRLSIIFNNNDIRKFQGQVVPNMTIADAIYSASAHSDFEFRYHINQEGDLEVMNIGSYVSSKTLSRWRFYLNGRSIDEADINKSFIKRGDLIEAIYN